MRIQHCLSVFVCVDSGKELIAYTNRALTAIVSDLLRILETKQVVLLESEVSPRDHSIPHTGCSS